MRIGFIISVIALVNLIFFYMGVSLNEDYFVGSFVGGIIIVVMEILYESGHPKDASQGKDEVKEC